MGQFRETLQVWCWHVPALGSVYFWPIALSNFVAPYFARHSKSSTSPSPSPSPSPAASTSCDLDELKVKIDNYLRLMAIFMAASLYMMCYICGIVESAQSEETNDVEEELLKIAREELNEAVKAVAKAQKALLISSASSVDQYVTAVGKKNMAIEKVEMAKPKKGLAKLPRMSQLWARFVFTLGLISSFEAGVCSALSFYYSLSLEIGCKNTASKIVPFVMIGLLSLAIHLQPMWIAWTRD